MKKLFSTPKKAVITTISIGAIVLAAGALISTAVIRSNLVGAETVKEIVLADAGLSADQISGFHTDLDYENGQFLYEADFYSNGIEYEYQLLAKNGEILTRDTDGAKRTADAGNAQAEVSTGTASEGANSSAADSAAGSGEQNALSEAEAKSAALADAGVAESDATFTKIHLDREKSVSVYEIEFYTADAEYDYEISAADGTVYERKSNPFQAAVFSEEEAKSVALADAGLTAEEVTALSARLDKEDGIHVYDIEFYTAQAEYDYEISAVDGTIRERNVKVFEAGSAVDSADHIGVDRAKEIAAAHAGIPLDEIQFTKAKLENDDGAVEYEIEFYHSGTEFEYSIDAVSGNVLKHHSEFR